MDILMLYHASAETENLMEKNCRSGSAGRLRKRLVIFEQHHRFIYKFIYAMLGDHGMAEELTQETFLGVGKIFIR